VSPEQSKFPSPYSSDHLPFHVTLNLMPIHGTEKIPRWKIRGDGKTGTRRSRWHNMKIEEITDPNEAYSVSCEMVVQCPLTSAIVSEMTLQYHNSNSSVRHHIVTIYCWLNPNGCIGLGNCNKIRFCHIFSSLINSFTSYRTTHSVVSSLMSL
jgi:hypothetical protein